MDNLNKIIASFDDYEEARQASNEELNRLFKEHGLEMPVTFPVSKNIGG